MHSKQSVAKQCLISSLALDKHSECIYKFGEILYDRASTIADERDPNSDEIRIEVGDIEAVFDIAYSHFVKTTINDVVLSKDAIDAIGRWRKHANRAYETDSPYFSASLIGGEKESRLALLLASDLKILADAILKIIDIVDKDNT